MLATCTHDTDDNHVCMHIMYTDLGAGGGLRLGWRGSSPGVSLQTPQLSGLQMRSAPSAAVLKHVSTSLQKTNCQTACWETGPLARRGRRSQTFQLEEAALCAAILSTLVAKTRWRCVASSS